MSPHGLDDPEADEATEGDPEPWDRQASEPAKAYAAFRTFRDMPSLKRSTTVIAGQIDLSERRVRALANKWDWFERAAAWDDACHQIEDQERLEAIRAMHALHRRAGRLAIAKAMAALNLLTPEAITQPTAIARLLEMGTRLERNTLLVSVEEMQGLEVIEEEGEDPWDRIARELDPTNADFSTPDSSL
jgi:hypothetical protein